jgi:hypothetical protein
MGAAEAPTRPASKVKAVRLSDHGSLVAKCEFWALRLFQTCSNGALSVVDLDTGRIQRDGTP